MSIRYLNAKTDLNSWQRIRRHNIPQLLALLMVFLAHPASAFDSMGYYIYQTSGMIGDQDIYITESGIKIINKSSGLTTIARAPNWQVTTFHEKSRTLCKQPLNKFFGYIDKKEFVATGGEWSKFPLTKSEQSKIANINATVYTTPTSFTEKQMKDWYRQFADSKFIKRARYCVSSDLKVPPKAVSALCKFYGTADKGGLPLEFKYHDLGGNFHVGLITSSVKEIKPEANIFAGPQDFRTVGSMKELLKEVKGSKTKKRRRLPLL